MPHKPPTQPTTLADHRGKQDTNDTTVDTATANTQSRPHNPTPTTTPTPTKTGGQGPVATGVHKVTAATATGKHPDPSRTRKLSLPAPMVLPPRGGGRVGRRRTSFQREGHQQWWPSRHFCVARDPFSVNSHASRHPVPQPPPARSVLVGAGRHGGSWR